MQSIVVPAFNGANQWWNAPQIDVPGSYTGCTSGATSNGSASCGSSANSPDVWYTFTAPAAGKVWVDTLGSEYDTVLSLHAPGQPNTSLVCNDDLVPGSVRDSRVTMNVAQGAQFMIRVSGFSNASGKFNLNIRMQCPADLTTGAIAGQAGYGVPNGMLNNDDFFYYLAQFAAGNMAVADMTTTAIPGQPGYGTPNGILNNDDFFYYLAPVRRRLLIIAESTRAATPAPTGRARKARPVSFLSRSPREPTLHPGAHPPPRSTLRACPDASCWPTSSPWSCSRSWPRRWSPSPPRPRRRPSRSCRASRRPPSPRSALNGEPGPRP